MGLELFRDDLLGSPSSCTYQDQGKLKNPFRIEENESEDNRRKREKASEVLDEYAENLRNQYSQGLENLLGCLLFIDPAKRIIAKAALDHGCLKSALNRYDDIVRARNRVRKRR